ncbi:MULTISPECIES: YoaK family protein [unclassified Variovorax]|uniref:YoaK family protein n=1 Tax=unclassified Variovorax TaxID=663243 RepID=UPI003F48DD18
MRAHIPRALVQLLFSRKTDRQLAGTLAFLSGAINVGGFLAVQRYTSNMTGTVSTISDDLASGHLDWALASVALLAMFMFGAAATGALIARARRLHLHWELAHPLLLEATLLLLFGLLGGCRDFLGEWFVPSATLLLCFGMGLQNAIVSNISRTEIRTTHMTSVLTDLGVELGRWIHGNPARGAHSQDAARTDFRKLALYATILALFVAGSVIGAIAFTTVGFVTTLPFAAVLIVLAMPSMLQDLWSMEDDSRGDVP